MGRSFSRCRYKEIGIELLVVHLLLRLPLVRAWESSCVMGNNGIRDMDSGYSMFGVLFAWCGCGKEERRLLVGYYYVRRGMLLWRWSPRLARASLSRLVGKVLTKRRLVFTESSVEKLYLFIIKLLLVCSGRKKDLMLNARCCAFEYWWRDGDIGFRGNV